MHACQELGLTVKCAFGETGRQSKSGRKSCITRVTEEGKMEFFGDALLGLKVSMFPARTSVQ